MNIEKYWVCKKLCIAEVMRVKCLLPIIFKTLKHSLECGFLHLSHACQTPATLLFVQFRDLGL